MLSLAEQIVHETKSTGYGFKEITVTSFFRVDNSKIIPVIHSWRRSKQQRVAMKKKR